MLDGQYTLPVAYYVGMILLLLGLFYGLRSLQRSWAPGYLAVLCTVGIWYFVEPLYTPENFFEFSPEVLALGFTSVSLFLIAFIIATPLMIDSLRPRMRGPHQPRRPGWIDGLNLEVVLYRIVGLWLILLAYGVVRVEGDILVALFPLDGRAGTTMWSRAAGGDAGATGFIVSSASYLYTVCLATFGILLPLSRRPRTTALLICLIAISWPYAFLQGSRNVTLAVVTPFFASYLLHSRQSKIIKLSILTIGVISLDFVMRLAVLYRNIGFRSIDLDLAQDGKHLGLNMATELMYITTFIENGNLHISYGAGYLAEIANMIPRTIWASKPLLGIDYAIARGFSSLDYDIGVFATISTGMIGQGVLNFGSFIGPIFVGIMMAFWVGLLNRLRTYGGLPRTALFLIGLGLTFNLGRDVTLLVLFPFLFGYAAVLLFEKFHIKRRSQLTDPISTPHVKASADRTAHLRPAITTNGATRDSPRRSKSL